MCFSAEAWALYDGYVKEFGADIDIKAFWEIYLGRDEKYRIRKNEADGPRIPKGMDLNFLHPKTDMENQILALIKTWNEQKIAETEPKLFAQVKRLADAERKLAVKETKTALNEQRVANNLIKRYKRWIADAKRISHEPKRDDRIFPDWYIPIMIVENGKRIVRPMRYHCRPAGMDPSIDKLKNGKTSGTYNARRDNLTRWWRKQFGYTHGLLLAETFYEQVVDANGVSHEIHFRPRDGATMYIPCLWSKWTDPKGIEPDLYSFAAITDEPEPEVAAEGHDRTVINMKPEYVDAWMDPDPNNLDAMFAIFDDKRHPYYEVIREAA